MTLLLDSKAARRALLSESDPEARQRLQRVLNRAALREVDALLPAYTPFWPDCDLTGWPFENPAAGKDQGPLTRFAEGSGFESTPECYSAWPNYRGRTKQRVFLWLVYGGDPERVRADLALACYLERATWKTNGGSVGKWLKANRPDLLNSCYDPTKTTP